MFPKLPLPSLRAMLNPNPPPRLPTSLRARSVPSILRGPTTSDSSQTGAAGTGVSGRPGIIRGLAGARGAHSPLVSSPLRGVGASGSDEHGFLTTHARRVIVRGSEPQPAPPTAPPARTKPPLPPKPHPAVSARVMPGRRIGAVAASAPDEHGFLTTHARRVMIRGADPQPAPPTPPPARTKPPIAPKPVFIPKPQPATASGGTAKTGARGGATSRTLLSDDQGFQTVQAHRVDVIPEPEPVAARIMPSRLVRPQRAQVASLPSVEGPATVITNLDDSTTPGDSPGATAPLPGSPTPPIADTQMAIGVRTRSPLVSRVLSAVERFMASGWPRQSVSYYNPDNLRFAVLQASGGVRLQFQSAALGYDATIHVDYRDRVSLSGGDLPGLYPFTVFFPSPERAAEFAAEIESCALADRQYITRHAELLGAVSDQTPGATPVVFFMQLDDDSFFRQQQCPGVTLSGADVNDLREGLREMFERAHIAHSDSSSGDALSLLGFTVWDTPTIPQIHSAYRRQSKRYHPDKGGDPMAFIVFTQAYEKLLKQHAKK